MTIPNRKSSSRQPLLERRHHRFIRGLVWLTFFACGVFTWIFKIKGSRDAADSVLPYSPMQLLIPMLGSGAIAVFMMRFRGRLLSPMARVWPSRFLIFGVGCIVTGAALHLAGEDAKSALFFILRWLMPFFFFYFFYLARSTGTSWRPILFGLATGALLSAVAVELARRGFNIPVRQQTSGRFGGFLNHPNQYGILLSTSSPMIVFFLHSSRRWERLLGLGLIPLYGLCLFQCLSKTNIILFFVSLTVCALLLAAQSPGKLLRSFVLMGVAFAVLIGLGGMGLRLLEDISPKDAQVFYDTMLNPTDARSIDSREEIWEDALAHIRAHPFTGLGPGRADEVLINNHAHNLFLQMWLDAGLIGEIGIVVVVIAILWRALQLVRRSFRPAVDRDDEELIRILSGPAIVLYVSGNLLSDSFGTATMPVLVIFAAFAFVVPPAPRGAPDSPTTR